MDSKTNIIVSRYELYPSESPTGVCVGFNVMKNGRSYYIDTIINIDDAKGKTDNEIVQMALSVLRPNINFWLSSVSSLSPIIGSTINF